MEYVLFYTFSTIAATFGNAVGIVVAAAVFRMQRINMIAAELAIQLAGGDAKDEARLKRLRTVQNWKVFLEEWRGQHPNNDPQNHLEKLYWLLEKTVERLSFIREWVRKLVKWTLVLIGCCFIGAVATPGLAEMSVLIRSGGTSINIPALLILGFALCILREYWQVIMLLTRPTDYDNP